MAVMKMLRLEVIAIQKDAKEIIRLLQREGVVEIAEKGFATDAFGHVDGKSSLALYESHLATVRDALKSLDEAASIRPSMLDSFTGRRELTSSDFTEHSKHNDDAYKMASEIHKYSLQMEADKQVLQHTRQLLEKYLPWESLDIPMEFNGTRHTFAFVGSLPAEYSADSLTASLKGTFTESGTDKNASSMKDETHTVPPFHVKIVSSSRELTCAVVICHRSDESEIRGALRSIGFVQPADPTTHQPSLRIGRYRARIQAAQDSMETCLTKISAFAPRRSELLFLLDYLSMKIERYRVLDHVLFSKKTVAVEGFCPAKYADRVKDVLAKNVTAHVEFREPEPDEDVPVLLKNNAFSSPVEDITAAYSLPSPSDIDPNPIMAFFYYLFFGMMLSDAAYGVLMVIGILFLLIFRKPEGAARKNLLKFLYCGMSTILWGALFGSWFGNVVYVVSGTFFGQTVALNPIWFDPVQNPLLLLVVSLILGFIHVLAAMAIKFYTLWRSGHRADAIMDIGFWWVVFIGIILLLVAMIYPLLPILNTIGMWVAIAGAVGLVATQGRSATNIAGKIFGGIASLYSITGYFSDILSYSRLMALGLVTGIIGTVVNTIGAIGGKSVFGVILFIVVFLFGHAINIGINALGAYVHGNRLQYVEFFSKFYEGGGRPFKPFSMQTKHFKLKEDK